MLDKISFISYPVSNLNRSIVFYRDLLGLKLLLSNTEWAEFHIGGQRIAIHKEIINKTTKTQSRPIVFFEAKPIETKVQRLESKGINFKGEIEAHPYGKLTLFIDPDENLLGLYEPS